METPRREPHILIVGLGNLLLMDDGVGVHALNRLMDSPPPGAQLVEIGVAVLDGLHLYEWADKILVIDAMQAGGIPGSVYLTRIDNVQDRPVEASLHELSLLGALRFLPEPPTPEIVVLGVEPSIIHYGMELTPEVQGALPQVEKTARDIVARWRVTAEEAVKEGEPSCLV